MSECVRRETTSALLMKVVSIKWKCQPWISTGQSRPPPSNFFCFVLFFYFKKGELQRSVHAIIKKMKKRKEKLNGLSCLFFSVMKGKSLKLPWLLAAFLLSHPPVWCCCICSFLGTHVVVRMVLPLISRGCVQFTCCHCRQFTSKVQRAWHDWGMCLF